MLDSKPKQRKMRFVNKSFKKLFLTVVLAMAITISQAYLITAYEAHIINVTATIINPCGNGILDPGEECDDGNKIDDDGCSNSCKLNCGPCEGQITFLTLKYNGLSPSFIRVEQKIDKAVVFENTVNQGEEFSFHGEWKKGMLSPEINIYKDEEFHINIHTSCSQPIGPGMVFGDFLVIYGESREGGPLCAEELVVINEFLPDPLGPDDASMPDGEWVELYNRGINDIDLNGWVLYDSHDDHALVITSANTNTGTSILPGQGWLVVYRNSHPDFSLNNNGDTVRLYDGFITDGARLRDSFTYYGIVPTQKSFARIPDGSYDWVDPYPTPGSANYVEEEEFIYDLREEPVEYEELNEQPLSDPLSVFTSLANIFPEPNNSSDPATTDTEENTEQSTGEEEEETEQADQDTDGVIVLPLSNIPDIEEEDQAGIEPDNFSEENNNSPEEEDISAPEEETAEENSEEPEVLDEAENNKEESQEEDLEIL